MPEKPFEIFEEDFTKTMMDYLMFKRTRSIASTLRSALGPAGCQIKTMYKAGYKLEEV